MKSMQADMCFVTAVDDEFSLALSVLIHSASANVGDATVDFLVIDCGLSTASRNQILSSCVSPGKRVEFIELPISLLGIAPSPRQSRISKATYARLFLDKLLDEGVHKLVYIDADTCVCRDISEIWSVDLGDTAIAAVPDLAIPTLASKGGLAYWATDWPLDVSAPYFNAGVMVIDMQRARDEKLFESALAYLRDAPVTNWNDQEALNAAVNGRFTQLGQEWNGMWYLLSPELLVLEDLVMKRVRIRHYAGPNKPWNWRKDGRPRPWGSSAFERVTRDLELTQLGPTNIS